MTTIILDQCPTCGLNREAAAYNMAQGDNTMKLLTEGCPECKRDFLLYEVRQEAEKAGVLEEYTQVCQLFSEVGGLELSIDKHRELKNILAEHEVQPVNPVDMHHWR